MTRLAVFIATFAHVGDFPVAPGTAGSAAGLLVFYLIGRGAVAQALAILVLFGLGVWSGTLAETFFGTTDPGPVVIDEVMGMLITLAGIPVGWAGVLLGFVIFRAMDVVKPFPAGRLEHLPGGLGVMADDAMAAVYANVLLRLAVWLVPALRLARLS